MKSTIRLFKAVPIKEKKKGKLSNKLLERTIRSGFVLAPEVVHNCSNISDLITMVEKELGLAPKKMNQTFHKSWNKVATADIMQLVFEQLVHYFTTYGFEALGIYNKESVYIPAEKLRIPALKDGGMKLVTIQGYTKEELKAKLLDLLSSGVALGDDTREDVLEVSLFVGLTAEDVEGIRNKEVRSELYSYLDMLPENPAEFLRYAVYKAITSPMLIKDRKTIDALKEQTDISINGMFKKYEMKHGLERLAEIFYRFKPIFLAFRINDDMKKRVNKIRKLARKHHKPMPRDYLNDVTAMIKHGSLSFKTLEERLKKVNTFRKIRLLNALNFRMGDPASILYRVRNGKGYAKDFVSYDSDKVKLKKAYDAVLKSIVKDIKKNVSGKKIYIPDYMKYALPATEKQFTGNFPTGTCVSVPYNMIFGVHWENVDDHRVDLDLSLISLDAKYGWDGAYRDDDRDILFSGDITDAPGPRGATELFYVKRNFSSSNILMVNYYNYGDRDGLVAPFKILVAKESVARFRKNYMVNPNNVVAVTPAKIKSQQMTLGLLVTDIPGCRFYFAQTEIGNSITSRNTEFVNHARQYLFDYHIRLPNLAEILKSAGAKLDCIREKCDIDLSPEALEKDTILKLLKKGD